MENLLAVASALYRQGQENQEILKQLAERRAAHTAALERLSVQGGDTSIWAQMEALARDVAQVQAMLQQAGRRKELSISPPGLDTALSVLAWLILLLLGGNGADIILQHLIIVLELLHLLDCALFQ